MWLLHVLDYNLNGKKRAGYSIAEKEDDRACAVFMLLSVIFLLWAMPKKLYAQSFGWSAAFVNFVPPVILFLVYYNWTEGLYSDEEEVSSRLWSRTMLAFPLGMATQLFSEHITLLALLYAGWILMFAWVRKRKITRFHMLYFLGTVAGAALMFSNGAYRRAATNPNGYKHIGFSLLSMYQQFSNTILDSLFLNNWILNILLAAALLYLIMRRGKRNLGNTWMALAICGFAVFSVWNMVCPEWVFLGNENLNNLVKIFLSLLWFVSVLLAVWNNMEGSHRYEICVLYLMAAMAAAPLLAANPIGERCFYISYILESLALLKIVRYIIRRGQIDFYYPTLIAACLATALLVVYARMFAMIGAADRSRAQIIEEAASTKVAKITLPILPYPGYYWTTVPQNEEWEMYFKSFYGIAQNVELKFK